MRSNEKGSIVHIVYNKEKEEEVKISRKLLSVTFPDSFVTPSALSLFCLALFIFSSFRHCLSLSVFLPLLLPKMTLLSVTWVIFTSGF